MLSEEELERVKELYERLKELPFEADHFSQMEWEEFEKINGKRMQDMNKKNLRHIELIKS